MTLTPQESSELEFVNILKSKHARYIDGVRVIDEDAVAEDYVSPGAAMGKIDSSGQYGPVTRGVVDSVTVGNDLITLDSEEENWNFQVDDEIEMLDSNGDKITPDGSDDLTITEIDGADITVTNIDGGEDYSSAEYVQKADGSSKAEFVCTELADVSDEDALVGGIVHGAVYSDRMPNYDSIVAEDLPMISFE